MTTTGRGARPPTRRPRRTTRALPERWGKGLGFEHLVPSVGDVEWGRAWLGRLAVHAATPASWEAFARMAQDIDVRHVAPAISVPTLDRPCGRRIRSATSRMHAFSRARSRERATSSSPGATTFRGSTRSPHSRRFASSSPARARQRRPTGCSPPCSSRIWWARRRVPPSSATVAGATCSNNTMRSCDASSPASTGARWTRRATASSRRSTARRARSGALRRSSRACDRSISTFGPVCTRARSSSPTGRSRASRSTSELASRVSPTRGRCWCRARSATSSRAPVSSSRTAARASLKGVPGEWRLFAVAA